MLPLHVVYSNTCRGGSVVLLRIHVLRRRRRSIWMMVLHDRRVLVLRRLLVILMRCRRRWWMRRMRQTIGSGIAMVDAMLHVMGRRRMWLHPVWRRSGWILARMGRCSRRSLMARVVREGTIHRRGRGMIRSRVVMSTVVRMIFLPFVS